MSASGADAAGPGTGDLPDAGIQPGGSAAGSSGPGDPASDGEVSPGDGATAGGTRRYPVGPAVLLAVAAVLLWSSSRLTWVTMVSSDGLTEPRTHRLDGGTWFGALTPLALVLLAAIAAVFATRGWLRRLVGVVVAVLAAMAAVPWFALVSGHSRTAERAGRLADLPARAVVEHVTTSWPAVWLSIVGALAAFVAGVMLARMPETTARMSGKYENPVFRRAAAAERVAGQQNRADDASERTASPASDQPLSERVLWDALDAGADPTEDDPGRRR
ncbi:TIGR02234 family membrane protein [Nocardia sp. alder85J]|uniref:TIGR02234 family membrane protein n=1 Tax=Nocardia sp. alder85J TaxID=2862949 RepID=UPI001CD1CB0C|nr:TIGR02234 family membrane protein [Nocardia sp. alder85J]MCX4095098.1 TIGR02234 family membrane protein [Nocardia sp. alder85J]